MTLRLALLILALGFAVVLAGIDFRVWEPSGDTHLPGLLGLSLGCYFASLLVRDR